MLATAAWSFSVMFVSLWATSLVPFYARGMHLFSDVALSYAGEPSYSRFGISYAVTFETVYGTSIFADIARSFVCFGPFVFAVVVGGVLFRLLIAWRRYSWQGIILRLAALLVTLVLVVLSFDVAGKFMVWGLG